MPNGYDEIGTDFSGPGEMKSRLEVLVAHLQRRVAFLLHKHPFKATNSTIVDMSLIPIAEHWSSIVFRVGSIHQPVPLHPPPSAATDSRRSASSGR
jgi:hypothetical protein